MKSRSQKDVEALIREIQRYLAFVEALRTIRPGRRGTDEKRA